MGNNPRFVVSGVKIVGRWDWSAKMSCIVCNLDIKKTQDAVRCPHCGNVSHKTHMLEWLHVRNKCPACNQHLSESELERILPEEDQR
ncbi:MAG: hypothetical protein WED05_01740 [Candidatus Atabeyarchaeum deiterrae]